MPDSILIDSLELTTHIGVPEAEREKAQRLTVSLRLEPREDFKKLGDDIGNAVDYFHVCERVKTLAKAKPRHLIETLVEEIAAMLLAKFALRAVEVELRKFILPDTRFVAVKIRREA
jgi:FolB domain-containing protein